MLLRKAHQLAHFACRNTSVLPEILASVDLQLLLFLFLALLPCSTQVVVARYTMSLGPSKADGSRAPLHATQAFCEVARSLRLSEPTAVGLLLYDLKEVLEEREREKKKNMKDVLYFTQPTLHLVVHLSRCILTPCC